MEDHLTTSPFFDNDQSAQEPVPAEKQVYTESSNKEILSQYTGKIVPVTLFTGYLGAGKTTIITNLIKNVPQEYKIAWLKNEIGNTAVDSELARQANVTTVKEIVKGCLCHYMIGSLNAALEEILLSHPDRIIIETSGSAAPAPIVWEIRKNPHLLVDGVVTVIDAINFTGYVNKSFALKMQAKYTDLILINKHEEMDEATLDAHLDDLYEINLDTPKIKTDHGSIDPDIAFGLDSKLFLTQESVAEEESHFSRDHQNAEVDLIEITPHDTFDIQKLTEDLKKFPKKNFYRIKGIVTTSLKSSVVINYAFGISTFTPIADHMDINPRVVFMGEDIMQHKQHIIDTFHVSEADLRYTPKEHLA